MIASLAFWEDPMRLGIGLASIALLAACSEARLQEARAALGCGPIDGLRQIGLDRPGYIVVGEFTETAEAPAAFAELACNLAASGEPLFVGVSEYLGGATAAETKMRERLDALKALGAPITVGVIDDSDRPYDTRDRTGSEKAWANSITAQVKASGATHSLLLVSHTDARNAAWPRGERFAGYDPMPMHLDGEVMSLEIGPTPAAGLRAPTVRLYPEKTNGFSGQIALATLTRPGLQLAVAAADPTPRSGPYFGAVSAEVDSVLKSDLSRLEKIDRLTTIYDRSLKDEEVWVLERLGQKIAPAPAEQRWQAARRLATQVVDRNVQTAADLERGGAAGQFQLDDTSPPAPPPQIQLPDFEATDDTP
jgi:hypothetical protein